MHLRTSPIVSRIVTKYFPRLLAIDPTGLDQNKWRRDVRVCAEVTMEDPLLTHFILDRPTDQTTKIKFRYEKIQEFCLYCGRLGHVTETCDWRQKDMEAGLPGIPDGTYKPSLKVGAICQSDSDDDPTPLRAAHSTVQPSFHPWSLHAFSNG
ncbi:hypothetical protein LINPERHAP1_LOCUS4947 [Linum perenne]